MDTDKSSEWVSLQVTPGDKQLLREIAKRDGDASMSASLRRLIRTEAAQRGIQIPAEVVEPDGMLTA